MELPIYTSLLSVDRRIYKIPGSEVELPRPVPFVPAMTFLVSIVVTLVVYHVLHLPVKMAAIMVALAGPTGLAYLMSQPVAFHKRPHEWLASRLNRWFAEPKRLANLEPLQEPSRVRVRVTSWERRRQRERSP